MLVSIIKTLTAAILGFPVVTGVVWQEGDTACQARLGSTAPLPVTIVASSRMMGCVCVPGHQGKVAEPIVSRIPVDVMHDLTACKRPVKMIGHDQSVFGDIPNGACFECVRVIGAEDIDIPIYGIRKLPAFPSAIILAAISMSSDVTRVGSLVDSGNRDLARIERFAASTSTFHNYSPFACIVTHTRQVSQVEVSFGKYLD